MANKTIKFKRGSSANLNGVTLQDGEPAFATDTKRLYIGIGGDKAEFAPYGTEATPGGGGAVTSVAGKTGDVQLVATDVGLDDATLGGKIRDAVLTGLSVATNTAITATDSILTALGKLQAQITLRATLASPTFTGSPKAPTATTGTNTTQLATTAFVQQEIDTIDGGTF